MNRAEWARADRVLAEAVETARVAREPGLEADAAVALAYVRLHTDPGFSQVDARGELENATRIFEELGDEAGLARALGVTGIIRFWAGGVESAAEELERAARLASAAGDRAQEAFSLQYLVLCLLDGPTPVGSALRGLDEIRRRAQGDRRLEVTILRARASLEAMAGRFDTARDLISEAKAIAQELGLMMMLHSGLPNRAGSVALLAGDAAAAERELGPACDALERAGNWGHYVTLVPLFADALYEQGRGQEAAGAIELASRSADQDDMDAQIGLRRVRARLTAQNGEFEEAERLAREAAELAASTEFLDAHARAVADLAEVHRLAGRAEEWATALGEAIRLYEQKGNVAAAGRLRARLADSPQAV
jgi:tetratricopeptide (TPR) repeat protein